MKNILYLLTLCLLSALQPLEAKATLQPVPFDQSMRHNHNYSVRFGKKSPTWCLYRELYNAFIAKNVQPDDPYVIPPLIHMVWLGSPLPERCKEMLESWKKFHPTWMVKLWTDADVEAFKLENLRAFKAAKNYGEKSDIWRYEILYRFGGLYVDTDFECLRPFDQIHKSCELFAGIAYTTNPLLYNGMIGVVPRHPIIRMCIDTIKRGPGDQNNDKIMQRTGPDHFTRCFNALAHAYIGKIVPFPPTFFYSFPNNQRWEKNHKKIKKLWVKPESMALHYWATSWVIRKHKKN